MNILLFSVCGNSVVHCCELAPIESESLLLLYHLGPTSIFGQKPVTVSNQLRETLLLWRLISLFRTISPFLLFYHEKIR